LRDFVVVASNNYDLLLDELLELDIVKNI